MRRIISILTVALIMAAMIVVMAAPAFAQGPFCGELVSREAKAGEIHAREQASPKFGQDVSGLCSPVQ
jgi:hypothetical protein